MKNIIKTIVNFTEKHRKSIIASVSVLILLGTVSGIFIYINNIQNKKEKELLSRIDNLEKQIKEDKLSDSDTNSVDSQKKESATNGMNTNTNEEVEIPSNNTTINKKEDNLKGSNINKTESSGTGTTTSGNVGGSTQSNSSTDTNTNEESKELVVSGRNGIKGINASRFGECLMVVSLTIDNWKNHISSVQIGETTVLVAETDKYYYLEKCRIELKHIETGETIVYSFPDKYTWGGELPKDFNLNNYECTSATGKVYFVNIPKEVIYTPLPEWGYDCGFMIIGNGGEKPYEIQSKTGRIYPNGVEDWEARYMK